jgi:trimeric autotransporter adhesin
MRAARGTGLDGRWRGLPAALVAGLVSVATLAGGGGAQAAAGGGLASPHQAVADRISTVAGGPGGPAVATKVSADPCSMSYADGRVYAGEISAVQAISTQTDWLTTSVGQGVVNLYGDISHGVPAAHANVEGCVSTADAAGDVFVTPFACQVGMVPASAGTYYGRAMKAGYLYPVAGEGDCGFSGDGGPAISAELNEPRAMAVDGSGNLVIADSYNNRIRVVAAKTGTFYGQQMTTGDVYTVAGTGTGAFSGDGGPAISAQLNEPRNVTVDGAGNLVISDTGNERVRVVAATTGTFYGQAMTAGDIYTVAGTGTLGFSGDGGPATQAELGPGGVAVDGAGNLVIADSYSNRIRVVAATTGTFYGQAMTAGYIYTIAGNGTSGYSGNGGPATSAGLYTPQAVVVDGSGDVVIAEYGSVEVVAAATGTFYGRPMTAGDIYGVTYNPLRAGLPGAGGPALRAQVSFPQAVTAGPDGSILFAVPDSRVLAVAGQTGTLYGQPVTAGDVYPVADASGHFGFLGDGGPATQARIDDPEAVATDAAGNLVIADTLNDRVRVVAAQTGTFYGQAMTAGDIYTIAGGGKASPGDGGPATAAKLLSPQGVAAGPGGSLLIADSGDHRIRVVAGTTGTFYGQAMTAGAIYTIAGGGTYRRHQPPTPVPHGMSVDSAGNAVISAPYNNEIWVVANTSGTFYGRAMTAGHLYVVAGTGGYGLSGDGGPAVKAELEFPTDVTADGSGNLVIADSGSDRVRVVAAQTGTFYGQAMTAGDIYTVAGTGTRGLSGDGGTATKATLNDPEAVAVDSAGDLLIADYYNERIREVAG